MALDEMKIYMSVDHVEHDDTILGLIESAHNDVVEYLWHTLTDARYKLYVESLCDDKIYVYRGPLLAEAVEKIEYFDATTKLLVEVDSADYYVSEAGIEPAVITFTTAPTNVMARKDAIVVSYCAGYGDAVKDVPEKYRLAVKRLVHYWYDTPMDTDRRFPSDVMHYLGKYRRMRFDIPEPLN